MCFGVDRKTSKMAGSPENVAAGTVMTGERMVYRVHFTAEDLVSCARDSSAEAGEGVEDLLSGLGPGERLRVLVPVLDPGADVRFDGLDALVRTPADHLVGQKAEPAFVG